uniref:Uncharacterized protein MANES_11G068800 n=1 Tax=Rhizophora mucronata TaxID=61149 RepID=A0A2P2K7J7_RHIMU
MGMSSLLTIIKQAVVAIL